LEKFAADLQKMTTLEQKIYEQKTVNQKPDEQKDEGQNRRRLTGIGPLADSLSKGIAAVAVAMYACGFLIVSLHHSSFGFIGTNPFRPRIAAAGASFLFLTAIPAFTATRLGGGQLSWRQLAQLSYPYYFGCLFLSIPVSVVFNFGDSSEFLAPPAVRWWWLIALIVFLGILVLLQDSKRIPPVVSAIASVLLVVFYVQASVRELFEHRFGLSSVGLWFFVIGMATIIELKVRPRSGDWEKTIFVALGALLLFAGVYYPHIEASWGGGTPVNITMYFTKDSAIRPSQAVSVRLVEESDEGFYIVGSKEAKAIYVPRNAVSLVYFSDKPTDSSLLRQEKRERYLNPILPARVGRGKLLG